MFPPVHYFNKDISMNAMPQRWFELLAKDKTNVLQDPRDFTGNDPALTTAKTPQGRPISEQQEKGTF